MKEYEEKLIINTPQDVFDRKLNLKIESDRQYILDKIKNILILNYKEINCAILFLLGHVNDEWLTIYPGGMVVVNAGPKRQVFDFLSDIIPLGLNLMNLQDLDKFDTLIRKLENHSHERIATILEISTASKYKNAGFEVELEPKNEKGGLSEFRVKWNGEWIFFECKTEYLEESGYYKEKVPYVQQLADEILGDAKNILGSNHRIDIILGDDFSFHAKAKGILANKILESLQNKEIEKWIYIDGNRFAINPKNLKIALPSTGMYHCSIILPSGRPTAVIRENADIQVIFNPFNSEESDKLGRILSKAYSQLPKKSRGIIITKLIHSKPMREHADNRLNILGSPGYKDYKNIIAVLIIGNDSIWCMPNNRHVDIPLNFLKIAVQDYILSREKYSQKR